MPGLAEEPLYGIDENPETGVPANGSIWEELIAEAGDLAIAGMQWAAGDTITNGDPTTIYADSTNSTSTTSLNWLWWTLGILAALALLVWAVKSKK